MPILNFWVHVIEIIISCDNIYYYITGHNVEILLIILESYNKTLVKAIQMESRNKYIYQQGSINLSINKHEKEKKVHT